MPRCLRETPVPLLEETLLKYEKEHPGSAAEYYRYNSASIRIRIVDSMFEGLSEDERENIAYSYIDQLPDSIANDITLLLLFTPDEIANPETTIFGLANLEFDDPRLSRL